MINYNDIFLDNSEDLLRPLIVEGLCQYFKVGKERLGKFLYESDLDKLPLPENSPALTKKGVVFQYQLYEIACFAAGLPSVTIPYDKLGDILKIRERLSDDK